MKLHIIILLATSLWLVRCPKKKMHKEPVSADKVINEHTPPDADYRLDD